MLYSFGRSFFFPPLYFEAFARHWSPTFCSLFVDFVILHVQLCSSFVSVLRLHPLFWSYSVACHLCLLVNCMPQLSFWEQQWVRICRLLFGVLPPIRRGGRRRRRNILMTSTSESLALVDAIWCLWHIPTKSQREYTSRSRVLYEWGRGLLRTSRKRGTHVLCMTQVDPIESGFLTLLGCNFCFDSEHSQH